MFSTFRYKAREENSTNKWMKEQPRLQNQLNKCELLDTKTQNSAFPCAKFLNRFQHQGCRTLATSLFNMQSYAILELRVID